jgi:ribonuclease/clavin/mitogillin
VLQTISSYPLNLLASCLAELYGSSPRSVNYYLGSREVDLIQVDFQNPGVMTLHGTNCYLLSASAGPDVTLIDTGSPAPSAAPFVNILADHLRSTGSVIRSIILTHHHVDHVGGLADILEYIETNGAPEPNIYKFKTPPSAEPAGRSVIGDDELDRLVQSHSSSSQGIKWLKDGDKITQHEHDNDMSLTVVHTPGHTSDSISLFSAATGEVFVGDTILG